AKPTRLLPPSGPWRAAAAPRGRAPRPRLPGSPAAPTLLSLLSSTLSGLARFFALLLRRPAPEAPLRRRDFSALIPALPAAGFSPGHEERSDRLSLLLRAALVLPGRPPGGRLPREVDASAGQSSPIPVSTAVSSHLTVRNQEEQRLRRTSYEVRTEDLPTCEESPGPTLEEASAWAQSFDKLMLTPAGRNAFREFLRTEFSEENMLFWMACEELKKEVNKAMIEEKARVIYEDYISILSPKEVSLDSRVREAINRSMAEPSRNIFDDAQLQIYTLMHRDSYPRFMNSALYKDLLRSLSEKAVEA
ncbi:hypothetical protein FD754_003096, partial [Muntiacus muntjak]